MATLGGSLLGCSRDTGCMELGRFELRLGDQLAIRSFDGEKPTCGIDAEQVGELTVSFSAGHEDDLEERGGAICRVERVKLEGDTITETRAARADHIGSSIGAVSFEKPHAVGAITIVGGDEFLVGAICPSEVGESCVWERPEVEEARGGLLFVAVEGDSSCAQAFEVEFE